MRKVVAFGPDQTSIEGSHIFAKPTSGEWVVIVTEEDDCNPHAYKTISDLVEAGPRARLKQNIPIGLYFHSIKSLANTRSA